MKSLALLLTLIFGISAQPVSLKPGNAGEEDAIRENVKYLETGWNTKSGKVFATPFAEDADYVVINGMYIKGRAAIEAAHERIFATVFKETTIELKVKQVRFLRPDVAVVHVSGHRDSPNKELVSDAMITMVMTKEKQGWIVSAFQNTDVTAQ